MNDLTEALPMAIPKKDKPNFIVGETEEDGSVVISALRSTRHSFNLNMKVEAMSKCVRLLHYVQ